MAYTTIDKPSDYFNTVLYTGTGSGNQSVTVGFQPDWVWTKNRVDAYGHNLYDSVRGVGKYLQSNGSSAESTSATSMVSFDSDGFTVGTGDNVQYSSNNGVSWNWLAGGTASSNTDGSITSSVSANTDSGFSIVTYSGNGTAGATVGHGLGATPKMFIVKRRDANDSWWTFNSNLGDNDAYLALHSTIGSSTSGGSGLWNSTAPTSSVFSIGTNGGVNNSSGTYVAYCFAEKKGYSKFGSYTGNGSSDGSFIFTGFKPAWVMIKRTDSTADWHIQDIKRDTFNAVDTSLFANTTDVDTTSSTYETDFLSNGFKLRGTTTARNGSGATYIYMAFAESPFVTGASAIPTTAR